jgi:lycopene cyclase domain-containing protein
MDHFQYLILMAACLAATAPLELLGAQVYRQGARLARAVLPVALVFVFWDALAIAGHVWAYNPRYITGIRLPFGIPVEEVVFFLVIPVCGILTYGGVQAVSRRWPAPSRDPAPGRGPAPGRRQAVRGRRS